MAKPKQPDPSAAAALPSSEQTGTQSSDDVDQSSWLSDRFAEIERLMAQRAYSTGIHRASESSCRKALLSAVIEVLAARGLSSTELRDLLQEVDLRSVFASAPPAATKELPSPWTDEKNRRRVALIDKKIQGTLSIAETLELVGLQREAAAYFDRVAPLPIEGAKRLHKELLEKERQRQRPAE